ncbi:MAG: acetyl-CoA C-acyltransferase [Thermomicrobiales bacterium]
MSDTVILEGARTPFGRLGGGLASLSAVELGSIAAGEAMKRSQVEAGDIDHLVMGQVLQAGSGQIPSRQVGFNIGLASTVTSDTINRVCGSGMRAVTLADLLISAGEYGTIIAGGMESMSNAPYLLKNARFGYRMGNGELFDSMVDDGLTCAVAEVHMGIHGSNVAAENECSRAVQDEFAYRSHMKAQAAYDEGRLPEEIVAVEIPGRRGQVTVVERDEAIRPDTTVEALSNLRPVFDPEGSVTAGNAPGVNDGAAAMVVTSASHAAELGVKPLATIVAHATSAWDVPYLAYTPQLAAEAALAKAGMTIEDMDVVEINEAFASVAVISSGRLGIDPDSVNPERWRDSDRAPDRCIRRSACPHAGLRTATARRWHRAGGDLLRRRSGDAIILRVDE